MAVVEARSFSGAARRLNVSAPAVTRAISALESRLGVQLLHRTTRHTRVTDAGERFAEDARRILQDVILAAEGAAGSHAAPSGRLVVTAPVMFGRRFVMPGILAYLARYPNTEVEAVFVDRVVNLMEEGIDAGVRIGPLPDSSMRALRVGSVRWIAVAAPEYLEAHGEPRHPDELHDHRLILSRAGSGAHDWTFAGMKGALPVRPRLTVTTNDGAVAAACAGFGVARVLSYQVSDEIRDGLLRRVLGSHETEPRPIHIVHREGRLASSKVRAFIDLMAETLRSERALQA